MQFNTHHPPKLRDKVLFTPSSQQHSPNCSGLSASLRCARTSRIHRVLNPQPTGLKRSLTNPPDHTSRDTLGGPVSRLRGVRANCDPQWLLHGIRLVPGSPTNARSHWEFGGRVEASIGRVRASLIYGGPTSHPTGLKGSITNTTGHPQRSCVHVLSTQYCIHHLSSTDQICSGMSNGCFIRFIGGRVDTNPHKFRVFSGEHLIVIRSSMLFTSPVSLLDDLSAELHNTKYQFVPVYFLMSPTKPAHVHLSFI